MNETQFARFMELIEARFQHIDSRFDRLEQDTGAAIAALHSEVAALRSEVAVLRTETRERFQEVYDRLDALERRVGWLGESVTETRVTVGRLTERMDRVETAIHDQTIRLNVLKHEIQQRFRGVTEQLAALEQKIAA
jgi:chromosome segregation ATPase